MSEGVTWATADSPEPFLLSEPVLGLDWPLVVLVIAKHPHSNHHETSKYRSIIHKSWRVHDPYKAIQQGCGKCQHLGLSLRSRVGSLGFHGFTP